MATLLLAQGTPMLCAGDEIGNSQQGNNNAYCQDNSTAWLDWASAESDFQAFVAEVIALRRETPLLHRDCWFGTRGNAGDATLAWFAPDGHEMQMHDWQDDGNPAFGLLLSGPTGKGSVDRLMILFNPDTHALTFSLPPGRWQLALDSSAEFPGESMLAHAPVSVPHQALLVLRAAPDSHADEGTPA